jgi:tetratricopeptide (TPR) repeat protein
MNNQLKVIAAFVVGFFLVVGCLVLLFSIESFYLYVLIYIILFMFWYKPMLILYHSLRAGHMLKKKAYDDVSKAYEQIMNIKKNEGYGLFAQGMAHYYQQAFKDATVSIEQAFKQGIKTQRKTTEPLAKMVLLACYMELKKWHKAQQIIEDLQEQINKDKHFPDKLKTLFYPLKGEFHVQHQHLEEGKKAFELGYSKYPELMGEEGYYYAQILKDEGRLDEAKKLLEQLLDEENDWRFFRVPKQKAVSLLQGISSSESE